MLNCMRIIKVVTPSNDIVNIEVSGEENELRDLLSTLAGVAPSDIKCGGSMDDVDL